MLPAGAAEIGTAECMAWLLICENSGSTMSIMEAK